MKSDFKPAIERRTTNLILKNGWDQILLAHAYYRKVALIGNNEAIFLENFRSEIVFHRLVVMMIEMSPATDHFKEENKRSSNMIRPSISRKI